MQKYIQDKFHFSNYQMRQLEYLYKTLLSETSKTIILLILFHNNIGSCLWTFLILSLLRTAAGGIHFHTYWGCLIATIIFFLLSITVFPNIILPKPIMVIALIGCGLINYKLAPITAPGHPELSEATIRHSKTKALGVIESYAVIMYITPENQYMQTGFWIIILHTLQLIIAKIQQMKEVE